MYNRTKAKSVEEYIELASAAQKTRIEIIRDLVQVLIVVKGDGYHQEKGKAAIRMKTGDVIRCEKGTEHWHAFSKESDITYLALYGGTKPTTWTEVLTQEAYDAIADQLKH